MANITLDTQASGTGIQGWFAAIGDRFIDALVRLGDLSAGAKAAQYAGKLAQLSDEQLAARGLTRDQIVEHAFGHLMTR